MAEGHRGPVLALDLLERRPQPPTRFAQKITGGDRLIKHLRREVPETQPVIESQEWQYGIAAPLRVCGLVADVAIEAYRSGNADLGLRIATALVPGLDETSEMFAPNCLAIGFLENDAWHDPEMQPFIGQWPHELQVEIRRQQAFSAQAHTEMDRQATARSDLWSTSRGQPVSLIEDQLHALGSHYPGYPGAELNVALTARVMTDKQWLYKQDIRVGRVRLGRRMGTHSVRLRLMGLFRRRKSASPPSRADHDDQLDRLTAEMLAEVDRRSESEALRHEMEREAVRLRAELDAQYPTPVVERSDAATRRAAREREAAADAVARAEGYQNAAHKRGSERGKAERALRTPADRIARAKSLGMVARAEYLTPEDEARALQPGPTGLPDARLERVRDRLLVVTPLGWVNPKSRTAYRAGLHSFQIQGTDHYEGAVKAGRFTPGAVVRLVREPDNPHDPNAIAVYAERARNKAGYVPASQAKRLAPLLDAGVDLVGVSMRGAGSGTAGTVPQILVCERLLCDHLNRT